MLPGFERIPETPPALRSKPPRAPKQFYLRIILDGKWYFLWKTHTNGGPVWHMESARGTRKPLRYRTYAGALRMLHRYRQGMNDKGHEVGVWND